MNDLILNKKTVDLLDNAEKKMSHAYLFVGKDGLGKTTAAKFFAEKIIGKNPNDGDKRRWILVVEPIDGKKLSLFQMKKVKEFCNRSSASGIDNKVVIIDRAENMGIEAYNSLLTLIEEPPKKTVIIMVANSALVIPKTILSRVQTIHFYPPTKDDLKKLGDGKMSNTYQDYIKSKPAKINLLDGDAQHIQDLFHKSEEFMSGSINQRLMIISTIQDKNQAKEFIDIMSFILQSKHPSGHLANSENLILAESHLYNNGNYKLVMETMALEFK